MKKIIPIALLLIATVAYAGSYAITTTASQDARLERQRVRLNKATCQSVQLAEGCTQAQARAKNPNANIYTTITDLIDRQILKGYLDGLRSVDTRDDAVQAAAAWVAMTDAQKNAVCALLGLPNGCEAWTR
jgi:hypothetical protein